MDYARSMVEYVDLIAVVGVSVIFLAFPAAVGAFSRGDPPRTAMLALFIGGGLFVYANSQRPGGYSFAEMPQLFLKVISGA
ncbi:MAG: hypothetical protein AAF762_12580 [Pseudomonadota bacterium]